MMVIAEKSPAAAAEVRKCEGSVVQQPLQVPRKRKGVVTDTERIHLNLEFEFVQAGPDVFGKALGREDLSTREALLTKEGLKFWVQKKRQYYIQSPSEISHRPA